MPNADSKDAGFFRTFHLTPQFAWTVILSIALAGGAWAVLSKQVNDNSVGIARLQDAVSDREGALTDLTLKIGELSNKMEWTRSDVKRIEQKIDKLSDKE